jgi:hypothetical protein
MARACVHSGTNGTDHPQGDQVNKTYRMRPKRHDAIIESIKLILDMPLDLSQEARDSLAKVMSQLRPSETWGFVMLNPEQQRLVLKAINNGPRPHATLKVWFAAISYIRYDTGEIMATRNRLADDAGLNPEHASRALARLYEIGALIRLSKGRYAINPHVGWTGSLVKRQEAAKHAPAPVLVLVK